VPIGLTVAVTFGDVVAGTVADVIDPVDWLPEPPPPPQAEHIMIPARANISVAVFDKDRRWWLFLILPFSTKMKFR
jgi:hypothetical protein